MMSTSRGRALAAAAVLALAAAAAAQDLAVAIKTVEPFPYCAIDHKGPFTDMGEVIGKLMGAMQAQGLLPEIRGPMVGVYHNSPVGTAPGDLSWEMGFVIMAQSTMQAPLVRRVWEHRTVAAATHVGPYDKTGEAVAKVMAWLDAQGYEATGPVLERYLDQNPMAVKPESLRTEIWVPCRKK
jgi:effector-binding domain-containing protein